MRDLLTWLPLLVLIILSTLITFIVSGKITQVLMPKEEPEEEGPEHE